MGGVVSAYMYVQLCKPVSAQRPEEDQVSCCIILLRQGLYLCPSVSTPHNAKITGTFYLGAWI